MKNKDHILQRASTLFEEGKYLHAIQLYVSLLEQNYFDRELVIGLINTYEKLDRSNAISNFAAAHERNISEDSTIYNFLMITLLKNNQFKAADKLADKGLESKLRNYFKGVIGYEQNDHEISVINFKEFIRRNKKSNYVPQALYYLAESYFKLKKFDDAYQIAKEAKYFLPDDDRIKILLAETCFELGMIQNAVKYLEEVGERADDRFKKISDNLKATQ